VLPPSKNPQRKSRPGVGRPLAENPDRVVEAFLDTHLHCAAAFERSQQTPQPVYDRIEYPPIKPYITRLYLLRRLCVLRRTCHRRSTGGSGAWIAV